VLGAAELELQDQGALTVGAYLGQWLCHTRTRVRPKTYDGYAGEIQLYAIPTLGELPLQSLGPLDLQHLYAALTERGLSGGTVLNLHLVLTQALAQAVRWGILAANPAAGAQPPRPRRPEPRVVDPALAERILSAAAGTPMELPCAIALATGMRRGEILALRWSDLDEGFAVAHVRRSLQVSGAGLHFVEPKTRRSRRAVALPSYLRPHLERQRVAQAVRRSACSSWNDSDLVIDSGDGSPLHPATLSGAWHRFLGRAGLPFVRFHDLRHAHATLLLLAGIHPKVVSERLGHASIGITLDIYSHVLPSMQEGAAAAFDEMFAQAPPPS
jgi:integrase